MKFECESCGQLAEAASLGVEDGQVVVKCSQCGAINRPESKAGSGPHEAAPLAEQREEVATGSVSTSAEPVEEEPESHSQPGPVRIHHDEIKCPKCFHTQLVRSNCARCGLDLSQSDLDKARWEPDPSGKEEAYARALELWAQIEISPGERQQHERFVSHCTNHHLLDLCTRRYREWISERPGDEPATEFMMVAVQRMEKVALAMMGTQAWAENLKDRVASVRRLLLFVSVVLVVLGLALLFLIMKKKQEVLPVDL